MTVLYLLKIYCHTKLETFSSACWYSCSQKVKRCQEEEASHGMLFILSSVQLPESLVGLLVRKSVIVILKLLFISLVDESNANEFVVESNLCADLQLVTRSGDGWQQLQQRHSDCCLQGCQAWQHRCVTLPHLWVHHWSCPPGSLYPQQQLPFWMDQGTKGHFSHPTTHMGLSTRHTLIMPTMQLWQHLHFLQITPQRNTRVGCLHVDIDSPSPPYWHGWRKHSPRPKLYSSHRPLVHLHVGKYFCYIAPHCASGEAMLILGSSFTCHHMKCFPTCMLVDSTLMSAPPLPSSYEVRHVSFNCVYSTQHRKNQPANSCNCSILLSVINNTFLKYLWFSCVLFHCKISHSIIYKYLCCSLLRSWVMSLISGGVSEEENSQLT